MLQIMSFLSKTMDFALKVMDFALKIMDFALKIMDFELQIMDFALKMMKLQAHPYDQLRPSEGTDTFSDIQNHAIMSAEK